MEIYKYKCIPLLLNLNLEEKNLNDTAIAYENILNEAEKAGWKFVKIDTIIPESIEDNSRVKNNLKTENICVKVFIFRKQTSASSDCFSEENSALNKNKISCPSCHSEVSKDDLYCENCACKLK